VAIASDSALHDSHVLKHSVEQNAFGIPHRITLDKASTARAPISARRCKSRIRGQLMTGNPQSKQVSIMRLQSQFGHFSSLAM
jgi:hypothetical protein